MRDSPLALSSPRRHSGFTLIELLVVIGIIVVLIGILLPVFHKIRIAAQTADTKNWVNELSTAIERYQQDFKAYPGPLANNEMDLIDTGATAFVPGGYTSFGYPSPAPTGYDLTTQLATQAGLHLTMSENLVLGLLGGLHADTTTTGQLDYDPSAVGGGPVSLTAILPTRHPAYLDSKQLSWQTLSTGKTGHFQDDSGSANDCIIPCFVDRFSDPLPILYMRAKVGANPGSGAVTCDTDYGDKNNKVVTDDLSENSAQYVGSPSPGPAIRAGQYDISQIIAYTAPYTGTWPSLTRDTAMPPTGQSIGIGKYAVGVYTTPPNGNNLYHGLQMAKWTSLSAAPTITKGVSPPYNYPYDAYPYLIGSAGVVRERDAFILISAGPDRVYGTEDDICNFGNVTN